LLNYKWYIGNAIDHLITEKAMYAKLRPMLLDKSIPTDDGNGKLTNADQTQLFAERVNETQPELEEVGNGDLSPFGLKMQYPDLVCGKLRTA
jgi:adenosine deaminase CECR1